MSSLLPRIDWPSETDHYKVVQVELDRIPYLRFGRGDDKHARILERFLYDSGVMYERVGGIRGEQIPSSEGRRYRVCGMGFAIVMPETKRAVFNGESADYGIGIDKKHLDDLGLFKSDSEWRVELTDH